MRSVPGLKNQEVYDNMEVRKGGYVLRNTGA